MFTLITATGRGDPTIIKRILVGLTIVGSIGLFIIIVLTTIEGVKYRIREEQGLDPVWAPDWVASISYFASLVVAFAVVGVIVTGLVALIHHKYRNARHPTTANNSSTT